MSNGQREYRVVSQVHTNRTDPTDGIVKSGWLVTIHDEQTGVQVPIFVPDDRYDAANVDALAHFHLNLVRSVSNLGA